jgi:hypothetical protein
MVFLARDERRFTNNDFLVYNSMRLFPLSTKPLWHGVCLLLYFMTQSHTMFGAFIAIGIMLIFAHQVSAQQSTAPPSSLSTRPLAVGTNESELLPSCDLCRKPEARPGTDLKPQRLRREKGLRPHKHAKGTHRSLDQSIKSTLPRRPSVPPNLQGQQDSQTRGLAE